MRKGLDWKSRFAHLEVSPLQEAMPAQSLCQCAPPAPAPLPLSGWCGTTQAALLTAFPLTLLQKYWMMGWESEQPREEGYRELKGVGAARLPGEGGESFRVGTEGLMFVQHFEAGKRRASGAAGGEEGAPKAADDGEMKRGPLARIREPRRRERGRWGEAGGTDK